MLVEVEDLVVSYDDGNVIAVDHVSLRVPAGQVLGILGGNGAGKTSTLRALGGIIPPSAGRLHLGGDDMTTPAGSEHARVRLGYCPDTGGLIRQATVREHVGIALGLRGETNRWPYALQLVDDFALTHVLDRETGGFSHGMSRRLSVLLAALTAETVLILDEPFDGVDPLGVNATERIIVAAAEAGLAVIVSTHLLSLLVRVTHRICVMVNGKIVADDTPESFAGAPGEQRYEELLVR